MKGEYGMMAGTTPPPGLYAGMWSSIDWGTELKTANGDTIHGPKMTQALFGPLVMWVSTLKILGANYSALVAVPWANTRIEFPRMRLRWLYPSPLAPNVMQFGKPTG
jgi:hypothetical protein